MAQDRNTEEALAPLSLREVGEALVKHLGLHAGLYDLGIEFKLAVGQVGPTQDSVLPGAIVGVSRIGLAEATSKGPNTIDASEVNPEKPPKKVAPKKLKKPTKKT